MDNLFGNGILATVSDLRSSQMKVYYMTSCRQNKVSVYTLEGTLVREWGEEGSADGQFQYPYCMAVDQGEVFIADSLNHRVQVFTKNGVFLRKWGKYGSHDGEFKYPKGIVIHNEVIYTSDSDNNRIQAFDRDGSYLFQWSTGN